MRTALGSTLIGQCVLVVVLTHTEAFAHHRFWVFCFMLPVFALAVWLLVRCRLARQPALLLILGTCAVFQLLAVTHAPTTSDDDYRYVWDAKVQLAGIDPYRYVPNAPQLVPQRDDFLFPHTTCPHRLADGCTAINRSAVHTIYPPVAEGAFVAIRIGSLGGRGGHLPIQLAGAFGVLATAWLLGRRASARGQSVWTVAVWAWCPLPIMEYSNAGHIDWLAVLLVVLAFSVAATRSGLAGLLVGAAIATKLYPAIMLAALLRRRPWVVLAAAGGLVAVSYLPHVIAVGTAVIGYLPGYLREEQYTSGNRLLLLGSVLPHPLDSVIGVLLLGGIAWLTWRRSNPESPEDTAVVLMGATLLIATPAYGWYAGLLLALIVMSGAFEWLPTALAPTLIYLVHLEFGPSPDISRAIYVVAAATALGVWLVRTRLGRARADGVAVGPA